MRTELDIIAQKDYAVKQGRAEGRAERNVEIAKAMLKDGLETEKVMAYTGLSRKEIEALK